MVAPGGRTILLALSSPGGALFVQNAAKGVGGLCRGGPGSPQVYADSVSGLRRSSPVCSDAATDGRPRPRRTGGIGEQRRQTAILQDALPLVSSRGRRSPMLH